MSSPVSRRLTERELVARIDHKLAIHGQALYRKPESGPEGPGRYDVIEMATNHLVRADIALEGLAREIGALADGESVQL